MLARLTNAKAVRVPLNFLNEICTTDTGLRFFEDTEH